MDRRDGGAGAHDGDAAAACDSYVLRGVLRAHAAAKETVVEVGDRFAQLPYARDRRVVEVARQDVDPRHTIGSVREAARVWLALAEIAPIGRIEAETPFLGLDRHVNHAGPRNWTKGGELREVVGGVLVRLIHRGRHSSRSPEMR
jgi:hypothetical protein